MTNDSYGADLLDHAGVSGIIAFEIVIIHDREFLERLSDLASGWRVGRIGDAAYAALYFLQWQAGTHGNRFASRKFKSDPRPEAGSWFADCDQMPAEGLTAFLARCFERYHFLGVIPNVSAALCAWLRGQWRLSVCERIPSPEEVLRMQCRGTRPVTILPASPRMLQPVLHRPNAFAFMVHDLEHAYKFFHDPELHEGQRKFFSVILELIEEGNLQRYEEDPIFAEKLSYLISDMNTHILHSLHFFRAILIEFYLRHEQKHRYDTLSSMACGEVSEMMQSMGARLGLSGDTAWLTIHPRRQSSGSGVGLCPKKRQ